MDQYEFIRTAHRVYGKNISELARLTGHSRGGLGVQRAGTTAFSGAGQLSFAH